MLNSTRGVKCQVIYLFTTFTCELFKWKQEPKKKDKREHHFRETLRRDTVATYNRANSDDCNRKQCRRVETWKDPLAVTLAEVYVNVQQWLPGHNFPLTARQMGKLTNVSSDPTSVTSPERKTMCKTFVCAQVYVFFPLLS